MIKGELSPEYGAWLIMPPRKKFLYSSKEDSSTFYGSLVRLL